jgi:glyoxylase-like metal-dependent hydrolase (beta-lactamase superfamily II)
MITVMRRAHCLSVLPAWLAALLIAVPCAAQTDGIDRAILPLHGALYAATDGARTSVVLVTTDGILVVDPMSLDFAQWLNSELESRFPDRPVKYVVYSRVDFDRIGGASLFNQTAEILAAEELNLSLEQRRALLPPRYAMLDRNHSGVLERSELAGIDQSPGLLRADFNGDGHLTPSKLWSGVLPAEASYRSRRVITLGGVRVELIQPGSALGDDATIVYFPAERLAFAAIFPSLTAPFVGRSGRPSAMADWARTITSLDIDALLSGEGETFTRGQVSDFSAYVTTLVTGVVAGYENGVSLEQLQRGTGIGPRRLIPTPTIRPFAVVNGSRVTHTAPPDFNAC